MTEVNKNIDNGKSKRTEILQKTWVVCALALVCTFLWGSASPCIKLGYALFEIPSGETWTQVLFAGMRFVLAGILTVLIGSLLQKKALVPAKTSAPSIVKLAIFQTILQYIFFYIGLAHNSGVKASIINGSNTFFVILVSALIFRQEKLDLKKVLGCIIGFAGVIVVKVASPGVILIGILLFFLFLDVLFVFRFFLAFVAHFLACAHIVFAADGSKFRFFGIRLFEIIGKRLFAVQFHSAHFAKILFIRVDEIQLTSGA